MPTLLCYILDLSHYFTSLKFYTQGLQSYITFLFNKKTPAMNAGVDFLLFFVPGGDSVVEIHSRKRKCVFHGVGKVDFVLRIIITVMKVPAIRGFKGHFFQSFTSAKGERPDTFYGFGDQDFGKRFAMLEGILVNFADRSYGQYL